MSSMFSQMAVFYKLYSIYCVSFLTGSKTVLGTSQHTSFFFMKTYSTEYIN